MLRETYKSWFKTEKKIGEIYDPKGEFVRKKEYINAAKCSHY